LFVDMIPKDLLVHAAVGIKNHARALRLAEVHLRCQHCKKTRSAKGSEGVGTSSIQESSSSGSTTSRPSSNNQQVAAGKVSLVKSYRDGANGQLPRLHRSTLETLVVIYANLEASDALNGVQAMRQVLLLYGT
jgi:hypothetical protein